VTLVAVVLGPGRESRFLVDLRKDLAQFLCVDPAAAGIADPRVIIIV